MKTTRFNIAVLDFNAYQVNMHIAELEVKETEQEAIEQFLIETGYNLDEINYMSGYEPIEISEDLPF